MFKTKAQKKPALVITRFVASGPFWRDWTILKLYFFLKYNLIFGYFGQLWSPTLPTCFTRWPTRPNVTRDGKISICFDQSYPPSSQLVTELFGSCFIKKSAVWAVRTLRLDLQPAAKRPHILIRARRRRHRIWGGFGIWKKLQISLFFPPRWDRRSGRAGPRPFKRTGN
jgi:hypothetical protein